MPEQITETTLKSSDGWLKHLNIDRAAILDPDGWDRSNFEASWNEQITLKEFYRRLNQSTVAFLCP